MRALCVGLLLGSVAWLGQNRSSSIATAAPGVDALGDIVGVWQSDTTNGASALSSCAWTPQHGAVLCEQTITTPGGTLHALNLFAFDSATAKFFLYVVAQPGDGMRAVPLAIDRHIWIYGGTRDANGSGSRTVNDFTQRDSYTWRVETTTDGEHWTAGFHGMSRRVR